MEITRRYLAGLMDGDGYIGLMKFKNPYGYHISPSIKLVLTQPEILYELQKKLGGHISIRKWPVEKTNWKTAYAWEHKTWVQAARVLDYIYPYLILKKPQAEIMKEFLSTKQPVNHGSRGLPDGVAKRREELTRAIKVLNYRGVPPAETERESS